LSNALYGVKFAQFQGGDAMLDLFFPGSSRRRRHLRLKLLLAIVGCFVGVWLVVGQAAQSSQPSGAGAVNTDSVTKAQFDEWMMKLSNWGRWGKDDERGALNLIAPEVRRRAAALVKTGTTVSLSRQIQAEAPGPSGQPRPINQNGSGANMFLISGDYLFERQEIDYHGGRLSHFDALCHVSYNGKLYNSLNFKEVVTERGCSKLSVNSARDGIVTRGVLLDLPGTRVRRQDVEAWEKKTGIKIGPGDALLLRSQRPGAQPAFGAAGYDPSLIPFLKERDIALLGNDSAQEGGTITGVTIPIHTFTIVALGLNLLDNLALDEVAATADKLKRWEFMLVVAPLRMENAAGSPVNVIATF
jgi:kynurenine formamidase